MNLLFNIAALGWSVAMIVAPHRFDPPLVMFSLLPLALFTFKLVKLAHLYVSRIGANIRQTFAAAHRGARAVAHDRRSGGERHVHAERAVLSHAQSQTAALSSAKDSPPRARKPLLLALLALAAVGLTRQIQISPDLAHRRPGRIERAGRIDVGRRAADPVHPVRRSTARLLVSALLCPRWLAARLPSTLSLRDAIARERLALGTRLSVDDDIRQQLTTQTARARSDRASGDFVAKPFAQPRRSFPQLLARASRGPTIARAMTDPSALLLSRIQFGFVMSFHIIFPAFTIGLASWLAFLAGLYLKTKRTLWRELYLFWLKIFAVSFALGVVSGIVMSFQFGTNWAELSARAGNMLGPLLAYEVLTAFFLEATFLGVMLFGWRRVSPQLHFFATCMVALGTLISTFWIISANSWMQTPAGTRSSMASSMRAAGCEIIFNPSFPVRARAHGARRVTSRPASSSAASARCICCDNVIAKAPS